MIDKVDSRKKEQLEDGIRSGGASRRADRQINIGRSRFIVMHPRCCVSKTLYILVSGVCTCTAACLEFKGGESNRSARGWKETLERGRGMESKWETEGGRNWGGGERLGIGERLESMRQKRSLVEINKSCWKPIILSYPDANTDRGREEEGCIFIIFLNGSRRMVETRFLPPLFLSVLNCTSRGSFEEI